MQFHGAARYTDALREFHAARVDWFAGDTIRGSLLASMLIAHCYGELKLFLAAKYYALAVGVLALKLENKDLRNLAGTGLLVAADPDYRIGAWIGFLDLARIGLVVHRQYDSDALDFERHQIVAQTVRNAATVLKLTRDSCPEVESAVRELLEATGVRQEVDEALESEEASWLNSLTALSPQELASAVGAAPFADTKHERCVSWRALGILWTIRFENDYDTVRAAERFIAMTQILLADLAGSDLCLLPTTVTIRLLLTTSDAQARDLPSNEGREWEILLRAHDSTNKEAVEQTHVETLAAIMPIISEISVLPTSELDQRTEDLFREGISSKALPAMIYDVLYRLMHPT